MLTKMLNKKFKTVDILDGKVNCFRKGFLASRNAPALSLSRIFLMGHFPRSKIISESSFLIKCCINTVINYFWERFGQY